MFLLIGESLGWQELFFIGMIALIVFGPRKLPQLARTIGKAMAEFRKVTGEFKDTWQKEVDFDDFKDEGQIKTISPIDSSIAKTEETKDKQLEVPEIREINQEEFEKNFKPLESENKPEKEVVKVSSAKQDWL